MQSEHPSDEAALVIQRGRVLGGLEPTRAFGDANYKWPAETHAKLVNNLLPPGTAARRSPRDLKTPPYVTADPVVTHRKLTFLPEALSSSSSSAPSSTTQQADPNIDSTLKFIVLATDGLWDELSSTDVVALVGGHISGVRSPSVAPSTIPVRETSGAAGVEGKDAIKRLKMAGKEENMKKWAFVDDNVSSHLIRNALGGADTEKLAYRASIPSGVARRFRDDITVTVVWYEEGKEEGLEGIKAKL